MGGRTGGGKFGGGDGGEMPRTRGSLQEEVVDGGGGGRTGGIARGGAGKTKVVVVPPGEIWLMAGGSRAGLRVGGTGFLPEGTMARGRREGGGERSAGAVVAGAVVAGAAVAVLGLPAVPGRSTVEALTSRSCLKPAASPGDSGPAAEGLEDVVLVAAAAAAAPAAGTSLEGEGDILMLVVLLGPACAREAGSCWRAALAVRWGMNLSRVSGAGMDLRGSAILLLLLLMLLFFLWPPAAGFLVGEVDDERGAMVEVEEVEVVGRRRGCRRRVAAGGKRNI